MHVVERLGVERNVTLELAGSIEHVEELAPLNGGPFGVHGEEEEEGGKDGDPHEAGEKREAVPVKDEGVEDEAVVPGKGKTSPRVADAEQKADDKAVGNEARGLDEDSTHLKQRDDNAAMDKGGRGLNGSGKPANHSHDVVLEIASIQERDGIDNEVATRNHGDDVSGKRKADCMLLPEDVHRGEVPPADVEEDPKAGKNSPKGMDQAHSSRCRSGSEKEVESNSDQSPAQDAD